MNEGLLLLIQQLVPVVTGFVARVRAERGTEPTDAEVIAHLTTDADAVVAVSDAWLAAHPHADES